VSQLRNREVNSPFGISKSRLSKKHLNPYTKEELNNELENILERNKYSTKKKKVKKVETKCSRMNIKTIFEDIRKSFVKEEDLLMNNSNFCIIY